MKKLLTTFILSFVWFISFCSAEKVENLLDIIDTDTITVNQWYTNFYTVSSSDYWVYCLNITDFEWWYDWSKVRFFMNNSASMFDWNNVNMFKNQTPSTVCIKVNQPYLYLYSDDNWLSITYKLYRLDILLDTNIPWWTSSQCQSEYNLIPINSVDTNYCVENNLCPTSENSWSALYINDIQHEGAWIINITIPEEYDWDYTWNEEEFNLDIIGYNVDTDYIEWIITNQTTKPNQTDLNNIITWVIPLFIPWLVIILFIYFVFRFLKKIF